MATPSASSAPQPLHLSSSALALLVLSLAAIPIFWIGLVELGGAWLTPEYSHGPLIPVISLFLFLRELHRAVPLEDARPQRWPGLAILALGLGIALLGNLMEVGDIAAYGLIVWTGGVVLTAMGWRRGRRHMLPVVHLIFMLPLPQALYWQITIALQGFSSVVGVWIVELAGIPVFLDGNIIDLGVYKLQVAEACSGLRYLFPILSFSYLMAILYRGPMAHKIILFAAAAPIAVAMNAVRIGIIGVLVDAYGTSHAEGFIHAFEGWAVFLVCVLLLLGLVWVLQRTRRAPLPLSQALDLETEGLGQQMAGVLRLRAAAPALLLAAALTAGAGAADHLIGGRAVDAPARDSFALFPRQLGEWRGAPSALAPDIEAVLGADDYLRSNYVAPGEDAPVELFSAYYADQTASGGIHSPEVCLPGGGWEIFSLEQVAVEVPGSDGFEVNRAVIQKGLAQQLVYYWFEQRGRQMTNDFNAKLVTLQDRLITGRADGAIVRVITPIQPGETEASAEARLQALLAESLDRLPRFVPG